LERKRTRERGGEGERNSNEPVDWWVHYRTGRGLQLAETTNAPSCHSAIAYTASLQSWSPVPCGHSDCSVLQV
jgi:hypothetical protein